MTDAISANAPKGTAAPTTDLSGFGGEFCNRALEAAFDWERLNETHRHSRILLIASAVLNCLFFVSDWRFYGTPQFLIAIPARAVIVLLALVCCAVLRHCRTPREVGMVMVGWMMINAMAVTALVTSHSNIALFVVIMLPTIYYMAVPTNFRWTLISGIGCSIMLLAGYGEHHASAGTGAGLALAMVTLNAALAMAVSRRNRVDRLHWLAARNERRIAAELARSRDLQEKTFAASPVPVVLTSGLDGRVLAVNESATELMGCPADEILGRPLTRFYVDPADQTLLRQMIQRDGVAPDFEVHLRRADGSTRFVLVKASSVQTAAGPVFISGVIDITERRATELSLEWLASTDELTGLSNRSTFFERGREEIKRAARTGQPLALMMIDIDHFKAINDSWGHQGGDRALRAFAALCLSRLREFDVIGRLGGEEFGILLPNADVAAAVAIGEKLRAALEKLPIPRAEGLTVTASFGVTSVLPEERDLDAAIGRADRALYCAKREGRNRVAVGKAPHPSSPIASHG